MQYIAMISILDFTVPNIAHLRNIMCRTLFSTFGTLFSGFGTSFFAFEICLLLKFQNQNQTTNCMQNVAISIVRGK